MNGFSLASEATQSLNFGESTKVRIGGHSVTLKGLFLRDDSSRMCELLRIEVEHKAAQKLLSDLKLPFDPWLGDDMANNNSRLERRIYQLSVLRTTFENRAKETERKCTDLRKKLDAMCEQLIALAKNHLFTTIAQVVEFKKDA